LLNNEACFLFRALEGLWGLKWICRGWEEAFRAK
jgi:hypothetical protein